MNTKAENIGEKNMKNVKRKKKKNIETKQNIRKNIYITKETKNYRNN